MLANSPTGLTTMAGHLLTAADKTGELAGRGLPTLVLYGADDNAWPPSTQAEMAAALRAEQVRLPGAAHSPAVETPGVTAQALTSFWNAVEGPGGNGGTGSPLSSQLR
jgi:pimeloyl-ACP methyl ester carboxylesterase